ncbi:MAG: alpha/beta fold hydrolase [Parvularculaceae bacterium]
MTDLKSPGAFAMPDADALSSVWKRVVSSSVDAAFASADRARSAPAPLAFDPTAPARAFAEFGAALMANPAALAAAQAKAMQEWASLFSGAGFGAPAIEPQKGDRRFSDPAWGEAPFDFLKQAYLLAARQMTDLVSQTSGLDSKTRARVDFFVRQYLYALSPANYPLTNPEAVKKAMETGGLNLLGGLANLLADIAAPDQWIARRAAGDFVLGRDLAATPGTVVFENDLMQLIQYAPSTEKARARPLLYVPPLVNKYYLMDLTPEASLFKWLIAEGFTVFAISWINPGAELQGKDFADYVLEGPVAALKAIEKAAGSEPVDIFSFCMGGAIAAAATACLNAKGEGRRIASLTLIGALMDYADLGEWSTFVEHAQIEAFNEHIDKTGMASGDDLKKLFSVVRANDLIWNSVVDHYLLDRKAPASDLLYWFADGANMTGAFLKTWSRDILHANKLCEGGLEVGGVPIDLSAISQPVFNVALKEDHVSGWEAVFRNGRYFGGQTRFLLGGSGHNAGVVNPPAKKKHGYWIDDRACESPADWLAGAEKREGSWWPEWRDFLVSGVLTQKSVAAREPGNGLAVIEPAPGRYVRG